MKLFVAKLNRDAVESDLLEWFGGIGPVRSAKIVTDRETGQSKCFGFVEMEDRDGGEKAIADMNGKEFMGFRMVVKEAEERGSRSRSNHNGGRPEGTRDNQENGSEPRSVPGNRQHNEGKSFFGTDKKAVRKKKAQRQKPDKYSDGPRQTKMKKTRGGGGSKGWSDYDEEY